MKSQQTLTSEDVDFIKDNEQHFDLVIKHRQHYQRSHDIASKVIKMAEKVTGKPVDYCDSCEDQAHVDVWNAYKKAEK